MYDSKNRKQLLKHRTVCVVGEDSNNMDVFLDMLMEDNNMF
jgi:hypothetical protein